MARRILHTLHLWLGLASGILLLAVALTGCMLAFEDEMRYATQHDLLYVKARPAPQLNVQQVLETVKRYDHALAVKQLSQIRYYGDAGKAIQVYTRDKKIIGVDPYTGKVLGVRDTKTDVLSVILSFHRTLLLGKVGEEIIYWNVWVFLAMLLSGLVIWLPPRIRQWRHNFSFKLAPPVKRNYDLHRMLGFCAWLPLFLIAITGIDMASGSEKGPQVKSTAHSHATFAPIAPGQRPASQSAADSLYDHVLAKVYHGEPYDMLRVTFPTDSTGVINIGIRYQANGFRKQSNFLFDRYTGALLRTEPYQHQNWRQTFFGSSYEIHTGRILGLPGKVVMFLAGLVALILPVTGFMVWWGKRAR